MFYACLLFPRLSLRHVGGMMMGCICRVGNQAFKMAFHSLVGTSLRLVHGADPVPTLPPSLL